MGVKVSKHNKVETKTLGNQTTENNVQCEKPTSQDQGCSANEQPVRFVNDGVENNGRSNIRCVPLVVNNTTNRPKFYYYPNRKTTDSSDETIFVASSQFPYKKPKAVYVRPRKSVFDGTTQSNHFHPFLDEANDRSRYKKYENTVTGAPDVNSDHKMYISKVPYRSHQSVNDRHWASSHVLPTNNFPSDRTIPHRTVAELRRSAISYPGVDAQFFTGEQFSRHAVEIAPGVNRPPTPSPTGWYPIRRTEDYLVASSLLAGEQEIDRRRAVGRDIHDF